MLPLHSRRTPARDAGRSRGERGYANFCRQGHTHAETARAIDRELKAGKTLEDIADMVGKTALWARNEHALLKLHPDLLKQMDPPIDKNARLSMKVALLLTQVEPDEQVKHYERAKHLKAEQAFHRLRTSRTFIATADVSERRDLRYLQRKLGQVRAHLKEARGWRV